MAGRVDHLRAGSRTAHLPQAQATRTAQPLLTRRQRLLFTLALLTFAVATFYAAIALLTRVTPALFKGQNLDIPFVQDVVASFPGPARVETPSAASVFNRRVNLLIIGLDKRPGASDGAYNTDVIMIATIDPVSNAISVLSFPRDMLVDIHHPGGFTYEDRINTSYAIGYQNNGQTFDAGASQLIKDIRENFTIDIDRWVVMDFKGVEQLVDAVGGITIDIPDELAVYDFYYTDDDVTNPHYVTFPPGINELDGYNAVAFGRNRHDNDLNRMKRQQLVFQGAFSAALNNGILSTDALDLWNAYGQVFKHNIPLTEVVSYLPLLRNSGGEMNFYSLGDPVNGVPTMIGYTIPETGAAVLKWNADNVRYWIAQTFTGAKYAKSVVEVRNGAGPNGVDQAEALTTFLKFDRGLPEVGLGPDVAVQPASSIILYSENRRPMAEDLARWIGIPTTAITVAPRTSDTQPDILIVIGTDFNGPTFP